MAYSALDRNGNTVRSPNARQMRQLLAALTADDGDDCCVVLIRDGQWGLSAYHSGLVCFENASAGEGPWHLAGLPVTRIIELWQMLADGNIDELRRLPWENGSGL